MASASGAATASQSRVGGGPASSRVAAAAWTAVFVARPILWPPWGDHREYGWSATDHAVGNAYVLAALALAVWAAIALANDVRRLGGPRPTSA